MLILIFFHRKPRPEGEGNKPSPESSAENSEEGMGFLFDPQGSTTSFVSSSIPEARAPSSPGKRNVDMEKGQHVPHLICESSVLLPSAARLIADPFSQTRRKNTDPRTIASIDRYLALTISFPLHSRYAI